MMATVIDLLHSLLRATVAAHAERRSDVPKPFTWPRPHRQRRSISVADLARRMRS